MLKPILPGPKEGSETEVMHHEGEILQLTSCPRRLSVQYWLSDIYISMCKTKRESNTTPCGVVWQQPGTPAGSPSCPAQIWGARPHRAPSGPLSPVIVLHAEPSLPDPGSAIPTCRSRVGLVAPSFPISPVPGGRSGSQGTETCGGGLSRPAARPPGRARLFCNSPGIINRSGSDRVFSKH